MFLGVFHCFVYFSLSLFLLVCRHGIFSYIYIYVSIYTYFYITFSMSNALAKRSGVIYRIVYCRCSCICFYDLLGFNVEPHAAILTIISAWYFAAGALRIAAPQYLWFAHGGSRRPPSVAGDNSLSEFAFHNDAATMRVRRNLNLSQADQSCCETKLVLWLALSVHSAINSTNCSTSKRSCQELRSPNQMSQVARFTSIHQWFIHQSCCT